MAPFDHMDTPLCITNYQWECYSTKTLREPELNFIREHVSGCEICADIKEGIDAMTFSGQLGEQVKALNKAVDSAILAKQKNRITFWYWSAAAMLILGVGLSWMLMNKKDVIADTTSMTEPTTDPTPAKEKEKLPLSLDTHKINSDLIGLTEQNSKSKDTEYHWKESNTKALKIREEASPVNAEDTEPSPEVVDQSKETSANGKAAIALDTLAPSVAINTNATMDDAVEKEVLFSSETRPDKSKASSVDMADKQIALAKAENKKRKAKGQHETYPASNGNSNNNSNYNVQSENTKVLLESSNAVDSADYSMAQRNFDSSYFDKCLVNLYFITHNTNSMYFEQGLFLKAKVLIKQNKNEDAKVALNTILLRNRKMQLEAAALLHTLK